MLIDDLIIVKNSLNQIYSDFNCLNAQALLRFCKDTIIKEKNNFTYKDLLDVVNRVFDVEIKYDNFYSFMKAIEKEEKFTKKKEKKTVKNEIEINDKKEIKKDTPKNEVPNLKTGSIVSQDTKKVNRKTITPDLPKIENQSGIIESNNTKRIK